MSKPILPTSIEEHFHRLAPKVSFCSLRVVRERSEFISVKQDILEPVRLGEDTGAMITVLDQGGLGYVATGDLTPDGLRRAFEEAHRWAHLSAGKSVSDFTAHLPEPVEGEYVSEEKISWYSIPLKEKVDLLQRECGRLAIDTRIVNRQASLWYTETDTLYLTTQGGRIRQLFRYLSPQLTAVANTGVNTQVRTFGGKMGYSRQGGWETLDLLGFSSAAPRIAEEALVLLMSPHCPSERMELLLAPDQMILQIHESIGHPLELDRILGDERNYAGTSFVTPSMFGNYRYGSDLLNITFDPSRQGEFASYRFDDEGQPAQKEYLIRRGVLERALGGFTSQKRASIPGVANARASSWNRPPIDRMANLNLEPGSSTLDEMIASVEHGIYMKTNNSWSIDDSRNKFQFGCEWGQLIENGKLTEVVKNPGYRGVSSVFWRDLKMVGNKDSFETLGSPFCGKGEPSQIIRVGHATPACLFTGVEVFGGD